jgi:eukaryotic-like serine/threonine-protein kinase
MKTAQTNELATASLTANLEGAFPGQAPARTPWLRDLPNQVFQPIDPRVRGVIAIVDGGSDGQHKRRDRDQERRSGESLQGGSVIDKYRVEEVLGHGAFATVYRATHLILQKQVALKVLHRHLLRKDPRFVDLLCEESRHTAQLDHPNIVRVFDVTRGQDTTYIVLEWVDGESLSKIVRRAGGITANAAIRVGLDVCAGLEAALGRGIVHRDIKPSNVLLLRDGSARIIDLGLARHDRSGGGALGRDAVVGTPGYMAPEQAAAARSVDFRADIWSLGATLYFALTGRLPFRIKTVAQVRALRPEDQPRPLRSLAPDTPPGLCDLVAAMLAWHPSDRPASYGELRRRLLALG